MTTDKLRVELAFLKEAQRQQLRTMAREACKGLLPHADQHDPDLARLVRETIARLDELCEKKPTH